MATTTPAESSSTEVCPWSHIFLMILQSVTSVRVSNISPSAQEKMIADFFAYWLKLSYYSNSL